jgi:hypothetical protein
MAAAAIGFFGTLIAASSMPSTQELNDSNAFSPNSEDLVDLNDLSLATAQDLIQAGDACLQAVYGLTEHEVRRGIYAEYAARVVPEHPAHVDINHPTVKNAINAVLNYDIREDNMRKLAYAKTDFTADRLVYVGSKAGTETDNKAVSIYKGNPNIDRRALVFSIYPGKDGETLNLQDQVTLGHQVSLDSNHDVALRLKDGLLDTAPAVEGKTRDCSKYKLSAPTV